MSEGGLLLPEILDDRSVAALWVVSPEGTIHRFGPRLEQPAPFPLVTGIVGPMPPGVLRGKLALFSKSDSSLVLVGPDGERATLLAHVEAPLFALPDARAGFLAWYPKSFDARVHLADAAGIEMPGLAGAGGRHLLLLAAHRGRRGVPARELPHPGGHAAPVGCHRRSAPGLSPLASRECSTPRRSP